MWFYNSLLECYYLAIKYIRIVYHDYGIQYATSWGCFRQHNICNFALGNKT